MPSLGWVRRNITQQPFTIFRRNVPARLALYPPTGLGIMMPICFMTSRWRAKDEGQDQAGDDGWREPPGYLGEAVRRAKRISSLRPPEPVAEPSAGRSVD